MKHALCSLNCACKKTTYLTPTVIANGKQLVPIYREVKPCSEASSHRPENDDKYQVFRQLLNNTVNPDFNVRQLFCF